MTERPATVVVVDDDTSVRRGLTRLLRVAGYNVETHASAREFLEAGNYSRAACLLLDVRMPGQSGLDLQEVLTAGGYDIPIIFITGHADIPMAVGAMRAEAADVLRKPFDEETLLNAIRQAISQRRRASASAEPPSLPESGAIPPRHGQ